MNLFKMDRLESLDALRGFDLFCLVALEGILHPLARAVDTPWMESFMWNFTHVEWEGFSPWDLVMPLFMFMAGISMPFSLGRYKQQPGSGAVWRRILKRVVLLWIFGMMCQGNLLGLDPNRIYLYTNTLQAIAAGYLIAALLFLHTGWRTQAATAVGLLLVYWGGMEFLTIGGFGGGCYTPDGNFAEGMDRAVLGRFRDGASVGDDGTVIFADWYRYTWLWSTLAFGATVVSGVLTGTWLKHSGATPAKKAGCLALAGVALVALGWLWGIELPVIKKLWTSSMVLVSSGYCCLLMAAFYYWIDVKGHRSHIGWLKVYGMNSIAAYMLANVVSFRCIGHSLLHGLEQYAGDYYPVLMAVANATIIYLILWAMYRKKLFLRV